MSADLNSAAIPAQRSAPAAEQATVPGIVRDIELAEPLPLLPAVQADGRRAEQAWLLIRLFSEPLGFLLLDLPEQGLTPAELAKAVEAELGDEVRKRLGDVPVPVHGLNPASEPDFLAQRRAVLTTAPHITVVVCTREHPAELTKCLDSLLAQEYPAFRVLVVDNAPVSDATAEVVRAAAARGPVDYMVEPKGGLSFARNAAVKAAPGQILAWLDDDEVADPHWLAEVARALHEHPDADVISGVIVPAELETKAQIWFEQFGGHSKGRGFKADEFGPHTRHIQSPLYPLPPFGTGANMTFRPGVIERIGLFDTALGAGTPAMGSEDTLAFTQVLLTGGTIVYQPSAVTRHYHRRDLEGLRKQMVGYGTGLVAAYTSLLLSRPVLIFPLLRLVPSALKDMTGKDTARTATIREDFPQELLSANRRGMLAGPRAYLRSRRAARAKVRATQA
ncbi:glycosyltransferase family 2 protein [Paractinoplanes hotanensis]|uniref:Glycosyltransferase family 2 protein n=1 Tax=Paractinoplanes hotanensis TaxID=2906497 RepID=A0ABT0Y104_9ACTN|nr:glycosyltransferase family 2 protein [Actinoplanes hotanensis]MCM4079716.1 glycosyltransferase family 2 protein [Actinoplanes hotanensis]